MGGYLYGAYRRLENWFEGAITGKHNSFSCHRVFMGVQYALQHVNQAKSGCLCTNMAATKLKVLSGDSPFEPVFEAPVRAIQVSDFTISNINVSCRNIGIRTNMSMKLHHECLAETHDFRVRSTFWIKVTAAFRAPHW